MKTFKKFIKSIKKSPLGFIKGECHLVSHCPDDFPPEEEMDDDFFKKNPPIITFSYKDKFIGKIILKKDIVMSCDFSKKENCNICLDIRENNMILDIFIKCPKDAGFPYLGEYGEFIASTRTMPS